MDSRPANPAILTGLCVAVLGLAVCDLGGAVRRLLAGHFGTPGVVRQQARPGRGDSTTLVR
jgi:hypothetical protein